MPALLILLINAVTHFIYFGHPAAVVFDEVYYGHFVSQYLHATFFFDQHPPLAKLLFALEGHLIGASRYNIDWGTIGNAIPQALVELRILPMVAGTLLPLVIYFLCRELKMSKLAAGTCAILLSLENSLVVQSRFVLPDLLLLLFGFGSLYIYFKYRNTANKRSRIWLITGAVLLASAALSIKWTGLTFLFLIICMEAWSILGNYRNKQESTRAKNISFIKKLLVGCAVPVLAAFLIYVSLFAIHFSLMNSSSSDNSFMSARFQKTLTGNRYSNDPTIHGENFLGKFVELNDVMYEANHNMTATHPYSSAWYTWPLMIRPIFYWQSSTTPDTNATVPMQSYIYLLGNPFIYWLGTLSIIFLLIYGLMILHSQDQDRLNPQRKKVLLFLGAAYLVNFLPFMFISRVMFLYHYEPALIISVMSMAFFLDLMPERAKTLTAAILIGVALAFFVYFAPLTYGTPLTDIELQSRMWLASWR